MARQIQKLNALAVQRACAPGLLGDGNGLYLQIANGGSKSWVMRFRLNGKSREMGLGSATTLSLAEARTRVLVFRKLLLEGIDPIEARREKHRLERVEAAKNVKFDDAARMYIETNRAAWKNKKHCEQWVTSLAIYASPVIGALSVGAIETDHVLRILRPIWGVKTETASRVRNRIELVLDFAAANGWYSGENPARWKGRLNKILPKRSTVQPTQHFAAMRIDEIPFFVARLQKQIGLGARALELLILTATRTKEVLEAKWEEISLIDRTWTIPSNRMKAKREHRVPLNGRVVEILSQLSRDRANEYLFPGRRAGQALSSMSMLITLRRMGFKLTVHGFRSTFRDWAAERTQFSSEIMEAALAHTLRNKSEAAYFRSDLFSKRRLLMNEWEQFCMSPVKNAAILEIKSRLV